METIVSAYGCAEEVDIFQCGGHGTLHMFKGPCFFKNGVKYEKGRLKTADLPTYKTPATRRFCVV